MSPPGRALLAVLLTVCWSALGTASTARADDPVTLSRDGRTTDRVGAPGDREDQVTAALDRLYESRRIQLRDVAGTAVEPALGKHEWAGAAIGAVNGCSASLAARAAPTPTITPGAPDPGTGNPSGASAVDLILPVVVVGGAAAVAGYTYTRRRRRATTRTTPGTTGRGRGPAGPGGRPRQPTSLSRLDGRAKRTLVDTDDAVRAGEEELGHATAQFGEEAAAPFAEAVGCAEGELTNAFRLRQQLDDALPEDEAERRRMLEQIIGRCRDANSRLDAVSENFDRLRAWERNAPQALVTAETAFRALAARVPSAAAALSAMRGRYAESASAPVGGAVEQAEDRLVFAMSRLNRARQSVDTGNNAAAGAYVRAAEGAVDQATVLVDAVDRRGRELAEAADLLSTALTETQTDLADAGGLLEGTAEGVSTADLRGRIARATSVLDDVREAMAAGPYDPIDALRRVEEADTALDEALAGAHERERGDQRARSRLDRATLIARSTLAAAADYVTIDRAAVGSRARTRLSEARRRLDRSRELAGIDDPQGALAQAQQADSLAGQARSLAEQDVRAYGGRGGAGGVPGGDGGPGGFGGFGGFGGQGTRGRRGGGGRF
ncbi:TPM domain-containing protein [Streptomyces sp. NPDC101194]|uniref:TPM domain-containing protein n=1 Tax=Streptomyces sp. NPDC101194 TaxID=3366127 RepID=UPI00380FDA93